MGEALLEAGLKLRLHDNEIILDNSVPAVTTGGFCDIFIGVHPTYGKVALKRPRITGTVFTDSQAKRFKQEAEIWKALSHPNILDFIGIIEAKGHIWLVSPFAKYGCLPEYLRDRPLVDRQDMLLQLAQGVSYLHHQGIVHGDIKGSNVLVSADDRVLVCDFGLAKMAGEDTAASVKGAGSARWQAPELWNEDSTRTFASDVYAYGMTICEIVSGNTPFSGYKTVAAIVSAVLARNERPRMEPLSSPRGDSYVPLWTMAERCWNVDPEKRPTMAVVVREFSASPPEAALPSSLYMLAPGEARMSYSSLPLDMLVGSSESGDSPPTSPFEERAGAETPTLASVWKISVVENPNDPNLFHIYVSRREFLTLTRSRSEIIELYKQLNTQFPKQSFPRFPLIETDGPPPSKPRLSGFLNRFSLSRLKSSVKGGDAARRSQASVQPEVPSARSSLKTSNSTLDLPDSAPQDVWKALSEYLTVAANDAAVERTRAWRRFIRVRENDLHSVRVEEGLRRIRTAD